MFACFRPSSLLNKPAKAVHRCIAEAGTAATGAAATFFNGLLIVVGRNVQPRPRQRDYGFRAVRFTADFLRVPLAALARLPVSLTAAS